MDKKRRKTDAQATASETEDKKDTYEKALAFAERCGALCDGEKSISRIPTGIVGIDFLLGGGLPQGRIIEIYGEESSGKTTLAGECSAAVQKAGFGAIYIDYEHAVDLDWFRKLGVEGTDLRSKDKFLFLQPNNAEDGLELAKRFICTGPYKLVVFDSVASMAPKAEVEGTMADQQMGLQARVMGKAMRKLNPILSKNGAVAIFLNQTRANLGPDQKYRPTITPGGKALKFHASVRIEVRRIGGKISDDEEAVGSRHRGYLRKQKTNMNQTGTVEFEIGPTGIDRIRHFKTCLLFTGVLQNKAGSYFFGDKRLVVRGQSPKATSVMLENILADEDKAAPLLKALMEQWKVTGDGDSDSE